MCMRLRKRASVIILLTLPAQVFDSCKALAMSSPVDSTCITIGFDVGNDQHERADRTRTQHTPPHGCKGHTRVSLLSKALANPSISLQLCFYDDDFSETDDDVECTDGNSSDSLFATSSTVSSPIPIQCSQSRCVFIEPLSRSFPGV